MPRHVSAVPAHEFGHFGQRSMGVSRYTDTSWRVIGHLVRVRGLFDDVVAFVSRIHIRIAGLVMEVLVVHAG